VGRCLNRGYDECQRAERCVGVELNVCVAIEKGSEVLSHTKCKVALIVRSAGEFRRWPIARVRPTAPAVEGCLVEALVPYSRLVGYVESRDAAPTEDDH
jgi:hypothetical protein